MVTAAIFLRVKERPDGADAGGRIFSDLLSLVRTELPSSRQVMGKETSINLRGKAMFRYAIIFAVIALIASLLGFGGVAGLSADFAKLLLIVAVVLVVLGFLFGRNRT